MITVPPCRAVAVTTFRGDRTRPSAARFLAALGAEKQNLGPGPTPADCLLYTGHAGLSTDGGMTFFGFSPAGTGMPVWQLMDRLKNGEAVPGVVRDDTSVFAAARGRGLLLVSFEVIFPDPPFQLFAAALDRERRKSQYSYGFPNGDGDCNCVTWMERLGLPLLSGRMNEFVGRQGIAAPTSRRFGRCV